MKNGKLRIKYFIFPAVALLLGAVLCFFSWNASPSPQEAKPSTKLSTLPEGTITSTVSGVVESYDFSRLSSRSSLIVYGRVSKIHDAILLQDSYGAVSIHTDVEIVPETVLRGTADNTVTLRLPGGLAAGQYKEYSEAPELFLDSRYLFFLYQPGMGSGVNEKGDYYYLTGMYQGVFSEAPDRIQKLTAASLKRESGDVILCNSARGSSLQSPQAICGIDKEISSVEAVLSLKTLEELFPSFNRENPIDKDIFRREAEDAYETNLENGIISQAEYEELLSQLDQYAKQVTPEQALTLQQETESEKDRLRGLVSAS